MRRQLPSNGDIDVLDNWQEVTRIVAPCPTVTDFSEQTIRPAGPIGGRFPSERPQILFGWVDRGNHNGGTGVRATSFIGAINGTTIEGRLVKSWVFTAIVANGTEEAREGYPSSEAVITLRKR